MEMNLIAMVKENGNIIYKRIVLTDSLQKEIMNHFLDLKDKLTKKKKVGYSVEYKLEKDEIFEIKNFKIEKEIIKAVKNPLTLKIITKEDLQNIKCLFCGRWDENGKFILFQVFDTRKVIYKKGVHLIYERNTFDKLKKPVITISNSIDALFENGNIIFKSFFNTRKIFENMYKYYKEATDEELEEFSQQKIIKIENQDWFFENADSEVRKRIALIKENRILERNFTTIHREAKKFGLGDFFDEDSKKIIVPSDKKKMKILLKFLNEDVFEAPITRRKFITNSKRPYQRG